MSNLIRTKRKHYRSFYLLSKTQILICKWGIIPLTSELWWWLKIPCGRLHRFRLEPKFSHPATGREGRTTFLLELHAGMFNSSAIYIFIPSRTIYIYLILIHFEITANHLKIRVFYSRRVYANLLWAHTGWHAVFSWVITSAVISSFCVCVCCVITALRVPFNYMFTTREVPYK